MSRDTSSQQLLEQIENRLRGHDSADAKLQAFLEVVMAHSACTVGTIHEFEATSETLRLRAHLGLPDSLLSKVQVIPMGKGMAGLAAARREPVQICNLQTDTSGMARPAAKDTMVQGSIAVPILAGTNLRGAFGIAKAEPYEFTEAESTLLLQAGNIVAKFFDER